MCEICDYFEGWTVGDAMGAHLPVHFLLRMGTTGVLETIGKAPARPLYCNAHLEGPPLTEGSLPSGTRPPGEFEEEGQLWHLICWNGTEGLFCEAVPLNWQYGIPVDDAREWLIKGKV